MELKAFDLIIEKLTPALLAQEFSAPADYEVENGKAMVFTSGNLAYGVFYDLKTKCFDLKSTTMEEGKEPKWRSLSTWMFDPETDTTGEAESIANDFLETVEGPKRVQLVMQNKKKRNKKEDGTLDADPQFLFNRLMGVFPELRDEMNQERIRYGKIRSFTFAKEHVAPKVEKLAKEYPGSEPFEKMCAVLNDMYAHADMDARSVITMSILNEVDDAAYENIREKLKDDLEKVYKFGRALKGKKVKPEKIKKKSKQKVVARNLNEM